MDSRHSIESNAVDDEEEDDEEDASDGDHDGDVMLMWMDGIIGVVTGVICVSNWYQTKQSDR
jgi:hypothetical protein